MRRATAAPPHPSTEECSQARLDIAAAEQRGRARAWIGTKGSSVDEREKTAMTFNNNATPNPIKTLPPREYQRINEEQKAI